MVKFVSPSSHSLVRRAGAPRRALALALLALAAGGSRASAQVFDSFISKVEVNQAIQTGSTPLVGGRATFVRATIRLVNPPSVPLPLDGLLHVIVDGVEAPGSPVFSSNGPYPDVNGTSPENYNATLNFIFLPPTSSNVVLKVDDNPPGPNFVAETNTANNSFSTPPLTFVAHKVTEMAYVPIDYRPTGGTIPNLPDPQQIEPGMGDNFVQGIYPTKDWYYHRSDAPSKLWTQSLAADGGALLNSLQVDINLMVPKPDFIYGFVPGALPYNGESFIGGNVAMGNTELNRYQRTVAHELGHNFGLQHNTLTTGLVGVDVEHHLNLPLGLSQIKSASLKDIMYAGLLTPEAWVALPSFTVFFNHPVFQGGTDSAADSNGGNAPALMIAGLWNRTTGAIELTDVLELPAGQLTPAAAAGDADLVVRTSAGGALVQQLPIVARSSLDQCEVCSGDAADSDKAPPTTAFSAILLAAGPGGAAIDSLAIGPAGSRNAKTLQVERTPSAPQVAFTAPGGPVLADGHVHVAWTGADADGDALTYYLRYSPDGSRFVPILTSTKLTQADVDLSALPGLVDGKGFFELLASDGLNTTGLRTQALSRSPKYKGTAGNPPWVTIVSPDNGYSFLKGATVILHSSGWDLEDKALTGASLQWSSSLDGPLGSGRLFSTSSLSVGTHVITVTATDSTSLVASDSATITIVDRGLPTLGETCQADLGFGGPGTSHLTVCGSGLATGNTSDLLLTGAPPLATAFAVMGLVNGPTSFKGGTLVPVPWILFTPLTTDINGEVSVPGIGGGSGPISLYLQFAIADPAQVQGVGLSNAVRMDFLP